MKIIIITATLLLSVIIKTVLIYAHRINPTIISPPFSTTSNNEGTADFFPDDNEYHDAAGTLDALLERLSRTGYDTRFRPHLRGYPVSIACSVHIGAITSISESNMDYTMDFYFRQSWDDYRLKWNSTDNEPVSMAGNIDFIWKPDSFFPNAKIAEFYDVTRHNGFARLLPRGHVRLSTRVKITAYCPMDLRYFPLDHQKCSLYIESFSLPIKDAIYLWGDGYNKQDYDAYHSLGFADEVSSLTQFEISGFRIQQTFAVRHDGYNHSRLVIDIYFTRNLGYYLIQVYLPAALVVISSWVSFWLPRNSSPARITLGVTTVLTVVTLSGQEHTTLPKISYLKALDIYLLFCFAIVFFSLLEFAVVSYALRHVIRRKKKTAWFCQLQHQPCEKPSDDLCQDDVFAYEQLTSPAPTPGQQQQHRLSAALQSHYRKRRLSKQETIFQDNNVQSEESITDTSRIWYLSIPSGVERISRVIFPLFFFTFNVFYWYYFFYLHHDPTEDDPGYISLY